METETEMKFSVDSSLVDICRLCLDLTNLQPTTNWQYLKEFKNFKFIEVLVGFKFPDYICAKCMNKLNEMGSFLKTCQNSYHVYTKMEQNCEKLKTKNVVQVIEKQGENSSEIEKCLTVESGIKDNLHLMFAVVIKPEPAEDKFIDEETYNVDQQNICTGMDIPKAARIIENNNHKKKSSSKIKKETESNILKICSTCGAKVTTLVSHYKKNTKCKPKNFKCTLCNLHFVTKHRMLSHQRVSHWNKISAKFLVCQQCSKLFKHAESLKRHIRIHTHGKEFMCEICGKSYGRQSELRDHKNSHTQSKPYSCTYCGKGFRARSNLFIHQVRHQKKLVKKSIPNCVCHICGQQFSKNYFLQHMQSHAGEDWKHKCTKCDITFETVQLYRQHCEIHSLKRFVCPSCYKRFSSPFCLENHIRVHTGERPFLCSDCGKKFTTSAQLKRHAMLIHNVNKGEPFHCKFCGKSFNLKENLRVHERIHTGERPYKCHVCSRDFIDATSRKRHVRRVHGVDEVKNIYTKN